MYQPSGHVGAGRDIPAKIILSIPGHDESVEPGRDRIDGSIHIEETHEVSLRGENPHGDVSLEFR
jgi:hypothetical protein